MGIIVQVNPKSLYVLDFGLIVYYICIILTTCYLLWSGFETPGEWEDHHRIFGIDGPDIQYTVS